MELFNIDQSVYCSICLPHLKSFSIAICKLGRRQICPHSNLNGLLVIVQILEEGDEPRYLFFIGLLLLPSLLSVGFKLDHFHDVIYIKIPRSSYMETTWSGLSAKKETMLWIYV